jgi:hypothetical protein
MTSGWAPLALPALLVLLAACQRPEAPAPDASAVERPVGATAEEQEQSAACRQWAAAQSEREFRRVQADPGVAFGRTIALRDRFDRFDAEKRRQTLFQRCMAEGGPQGPR